MPGLIFVIVVIHVIVIYQNLMYVIVMYHVIVVEEVEVLVLLVQLAKPGKLVLLGLQGQLVKPVLLDQQGQQDLRAILEVFYMKV
jgi:hypothetical protein